MTSLEEVLDHCLPDILAKYNHSILYDVDRRGGFQYFVWCPVPYHKTARRLRIAGCPWLECRNYTVVYEVLPDGSPGEVICGWPDGPFECPTWPWWDDRPWCWMQTNFIITTSASTQTTNNPATWVQAGSSIETIGSGAGGGNQTAAGAAGGGGAYNKASNVALTPSASATFFLNVGGAGNTGAVTLGPDCWYNGATLGASSCGSKGAAASATSTGGAGGAFASGIPSGSGNNGGNGGSITSTGTPGGGAAGGPNGAGGTGGNASNTGGGGGGGTGAHNGTASTTSSGQAGGNGFGGTGGGAANGGAGSLGGGGGGGNSGVNGGAGGAGQDWDASHGAGGGGGGLGAPSGGGGGVGGALYGAGSSSASTVTAAGGTGAQGIIVLTWTPGGGGGCVSTRTMLGVGCGIRVLKAMSRNELVERRNLIKSLFGEVN